MRPGKLTGKPGRCLVVALVVVWEILRIGVLLMLRLVVMGAMIVVVVVAVAVEVVWYMLRIRVLLMLWLE